MEYVVISAYASSLPTSSSGFCTVRASFFPPRRIIRPTISPASMQAPDIAHSPERDTLARQPLALGRFWTVANALSLLRMVLVAPITYLILSDGSRAWLFGLIMAGVMTDWLDGNVARWTRTVSDWGKVLDPLADKVAAIFITLALFLKGSLPLWFLVFIAVRDVLIALGGALMTRKSGEVAMSVWSGKVAVTLLALTLIAALMQADEDVMQVLIGATSVALAWSFLIYIIRFIRVMTRPSAQ